MSIETRATQWKEFDFEGRTLYAKAIYLQKKGLWMQVVHFNDRPATNYTEINHNVNWDGFMSRAERNRRYSEDRSLVNG